MADPRRLQHAVAGVHHERLTLVLVDHADPALVTIDELELDRVVVDVVGHRPAVGDRFERQLVAGGNVAARDEADRTVNQLRAGTDGPLDHGDVVGVTEQQSEVGKSCFFGHQVTLAGEAVGGPRTSPVRVG